MWNSSLKLIIIVALLGSACRAQREISQPGYIIGPTNDIERLPDTDIEDIDIPRAVLERATKASILTVTELSNGKQKYCSGSLIEGRNAGDLPRIVTNHHCFAKKISGTSRSLPEIVPEACKETSVYFDFSLEAEPLKRKCESGSLVTNFAADFAVFSLDEELPADYEPFKIWDGEVPSNRAAFIIHHPSAKGSKQGRESEAMLKGVGAYFPKKAITVNNCKVLGRFEEHYWPLNPNLPFGLRHTCDLVHGSSGSGLIDLTTGDLLGVNWGGITLTVNKIDRKDNVASSAQFLREFVDSDAVTSPPMPPQKKDFTSCARIAGHEAMSHELLLLTLFAPLLIVGRRRLSLH